MLQKDHIISYRVYVEDTDLMGIVYHARYLYFFERARTELLRNFGLSLTALADMNTYFAIREVHICYHYPARLDDVLSITTTVGQRKACTLQFKQIMMNQNQKIISEATVVTVIVDEALKPKRIPDILIGG